MSVEMQGVVTFIAVNVGTVLPLYIFMLGYR
jgi:hypothetical protein